jgi:hypothetical protein
MRAILILLLAALATPSLAQAVAKIDTELTKGRCRFIADDGEVGDYALNRCPGLAGAQVETVAGAGNVALSFRYGRKLVKDVVREWSIGSKLEWRGTRNAKGFTPHASIVQLIVMDRDTMDRDKPEKHNVWAVIRMEPRNACLMAVIDASANPDALTLARNIADAEAPNTACVTGKDSLKPKIVGTQTRWAKEAAGLDEPPAR